MRLLPASICLWLFWAVDAYACSCGNFRSDGQESNACNSLQSTKIVFVGKVTVDSGEGWGTGLARMAVEEILHGLPADMKEVEVETAAGTSCYMRFKLNERYVVYGHQGDRPDLVVRDTCSFSFNVVGREKLLEALKQVEIGGERRMVGRVVRKQDKYFATDEGVPNLKIIAQGIQSRFEATTDATGQFEFRDIPPEAYKLQIGSEDWWRDEVPWQNAPLNLPERGCQVQTLQAYPNGRIGGIVRDKEGRPLAGITVQAFTFDAKGQLGTQPLREAKTDSNGKYLFSGLPPAEFVIGVNGNKYDDKSPYPPTLYPGVGERDKAWRIPLAQAELKTDMDLVLPAARQEGVLVVETVYEDGSAAPISTINVEDLSGTQRFFWMYRDKPGPNVIELKVYQGETYTVKASHTEVSAISLGGGRMRGSVRQWDGTEGPVHVNAPEIHVRVVLRRDPRFK